MSHGTGSSNSGAGLGGGGGSGGHWPLREVADTTWERMEARRQTRYEVLRAAFEEINYSFQHPGTAAPGNRLDLAVVEYVRAMDETLVNRVDTISVPDGAKRIVVTWQEPEPSGEYPPLADRVGTADADADEAPRAVYPATPGSPEPSDFDYRAGSAATPEQARERGDNLMGP